MSTLLLKPKAKSTYAMSLSKDKEALFLYLEKLGDSPQIISSVLWLSYYSPEYMLSTNGFSKDANINVIRRETLRLLKLTSPEIWESVTSDPVTECEKILCDKLPKGSFGLVKYKIIKFVKVADRDVIDRACFLLTSEEQKNQFGGLRSILLKFNESQYLLPVAFDIGNMIKDLMQNEEIARDITEQPFIETTAISTNDNINSIVAFKKIADSLIKKGFSMEFLSKIIVSKDVAKDISEFCRISNSLIGKELTPEFLLLLILGN